MAVPEHNADLRWGGTLPGELADVVDDLFGGGLEPGGDGARVWDGGGGDTLSLAVKTTHFDGGELLARGCFGELCRLVALNTASGAEVKIRGRVGAGNCQEV